MRRIQLELRACKDKLAEIPPKIDPNRIKAATVSTRIKELHSQVLDYSKGSKNFWSSVKTVKNAETSSIPHLIKDGQTFTQSVENANILAEMFSKNSSLYESYQPPPFTSRSTCTTFMPEVHIQTRQVKRVLAKLEIKKSSGPDGISARVIKICSSSLAKPLRNLFFISFKTGTFPSCWKIANVQPVSKKGDPSDPGNYRPIAICSNLAKVMESTLNHKRMKYLKDNSLLNDLNGYYLLGKNLQYQ